MRKLSGCVAWAAAALVPAGLWAQPRAGYSSVAVGTAALPSELQLARSNLAQMWVAKVDHQNREVIRSLSYYEGSTVRRAAAEPGQPAPPGVRERDAMLFAMTNFGSLHCYDLETGAFRWRANLGDDGLTAFPPAVVGDYVYAVAGNRVLQLERATGRVALSRNMRNQASAGPAATAEEIFVPLQGGQLISYELPDPVASRANAVFQTDKYRPDPLQPGGKEYIVGLPPGRSRRYEALPEKWITPLTRGDLIGPPLLAGGDVIYCLADGEIVSTRILGKANNLRIFNRLALNPTGVATLGRRLYYQTTGTPAKKGDFRVYCTNTSHGRDYWNYGAGDELVSAPLPFLDDVLLSVRSSGVHCVANADGVRKWTNPQAKRAVAMNDRFVYALDRSGNLLTLSRKDGATLALLPMGGFKVAAANQLNDRLALATPEGLLVMLRDRQNEKPIVHPQRGGGDRADPGEGELLGPQGKDKKTDEPNPDSPVDAPKPKVAPRAPKTAAPKAGAAKGGAAKGAEPADAMDADAAPKANAPPPKAKPKAALDDDL